MYFTAFCYDDYMLLGDFSAHYNLIGPLLHMWFIIDQNDVMLCMTLGNCIFKEELASYRKLESCLIICD